METVQNEKIYDLEERTLVFAAKIREFVRVLPKNVLGTVEDSKQLIRSSGSVGANYIEANEALSKKDFEMRIRICRKEAKESRFWLDLLATAENETLDKIRMELRKEAFELTCIFSSILQKSKLSSKTKEF